jgi:DNA-binding LytR/AlgR family response regulator
MQAIAASNVLDVYIALYIDPLTERQVSGAAFDAISYLHNFIDEETFVDALPRPFSFDLAQDMELQCSLEPCEEHI